VADYFTVYKCLVSKANQAGGGPALDPTMPAFAEASGQVGRAVGLPSGAWVDRIIESMLAAGQAAGAAEAKTRYDISDDVANKAAAGLVDLLNKTGCATIGATSTAGRVVEPVATPSTGMVRIAANPIFSAQQLFQAGMMVSALPAEQVAPATPVASSNKNLPIIVGAAAIAALLLLR
jgi:hypothetical protein